MTLTRHAKAIAQELAERRVVAQKAEYRDKLQRIQGAFTPPLTNSELSAGLDLKAPEAGAPGQSEVGRFVSASPRLRRVRPDGTLRALIDAVLEGDLLIAVQDAVPGARRAVLICDGRDIRHMGRDWEVRNLAGGPIPERLPRGDESWDDDGLWDLFGADTPAAAPAAESAGAVPAVAEGWTADRSAPWTPRGPLPTRFLNGKAVGAVGLGAMRLSTRGRPDGAVAIAVLHAAWDAGVTLVDTADSYCLDADEAGHNERLIRKALDAWGGDRDRVSIATKAGLIRPGGRWLPDGRPEHLRASCEASLRNLGVEALNLFQLHTPDRRVPFADSVGELARLAEEGKVRAVGLCNIGLPQLDEARDLVTVASVQNGCSYFDTAPLRSGLLERCAELGIPFLAHSPLGGHRKAERVGRDKALAAVAERHGATAHQVALAWLLSLGPGILPLCGATRASSVTASAAAASLSLGVDDLALLDVDKRAAAGPIRGRLQSSAWAAETPAAAAEAPGPQAEAILVMGPPGAGKTRYVEPLVERGYVRLNRDLEGGKLDDLVPKMAAELDAGRRSFVLDNTYPTRTSRRRVLDLAKRRGLAAVGIRIDAPVEEALFNACLRMLDRHGRILSPDEIRQLSKADPNMLPPAAVYRYFQTFEAPTEAEGFGRLDTVPFERLTHPAYKNRALILDYDGTLRKTRSGAPFPSEPDDIEILPRRREILDRHRDDGWLLLGISNQSAVGRGQLDEATVRACFERTNELLGHDIDVRFCPHPATSAGVWCRKPMPGLGVALIEEHKLDRGACLFVGDLDTDRGLAQNCGFRFEHASTFFGDGDEPAESD